MLATCVHADLNESDAAEQGRRAEVAYDSLVYASLPFYNVFCSNSFIR
jgi:hypothetical protein